MAWFGRRGRKLPAALVAEAKTRPGGWVYQVVGTWAYDDQIPTEAVRGGWKVDDNGVIEGDFVPNPDFKPKPEFGFQSQDGSPDPYARYRKWP